MKCESCGATVSPRDLQLGSCGYCNSPLATAVDEAAKQAALQELMADRDGDGVPDVLQAMDEKKRTQKEREALQDKIAGTRVLLTNSRNARFRLSTLGWLAPIIALVLGTLWMIVVTGLLDADPWLGGHHRVYCPKTCAGCTGPYVFHSWTTTRMSGGSKSSSSTTLVYCRPPSVQLESLDWSTMHSKIEAHRPYQLSGGLWRLWWASLLLWLLPSVGLTALLLRWSMKRARAAVPALEARIAALEAQLDEAPARAP